MAVLINDIVIVSENYVEFAVVQFAFCHIAFTKTVEFVSNICNTVVHIKSLELPYTVVFDYTNITFTDNICSDRVISIQAAVNDVFPYCFFQYMTLTNLTYGEPRLYNISFSG